MDYLRCIEEAINYIENNLEVELNYQDIAKVAGISNSYFQQIFKMVCGLTLGEYIRKRKLTKAAIDILMKNESVTTIAFKYGYSSDGFTRVFKKNYGCNPSSLKDISQITLFNRFDIKKFVEGEIMNYRVVEKYSFELLGYKKHLNCNLEERIEKVTEMWLETRKKQYELLKYRKSNDIRWLEVSTNLTENEFDHYISVDTKETSEDFEKIIIPKKDYAVFKTENCSYPTAIYMDLRKQIFSKGFENSKYELDDGLEVVIDYWYPDINDKKRRYIEIWIPIRNNISV